jgi:hypothetical protein
MNFGGVAKRVVRLIWVLAVNGFIVRMTFTSLFGDPFNPKAVTSHNKLQFVLWIALPIAGMILESVNWRFARWINVGYLAAYGLDDLAGAIRYWSDPYHGVLVLVGGSLVVLAYITDVIYRATKDSRKPSENLISNPQRMI